MGRGIGKTQQAILDALAEQPRGAISAVGLAEHLGISGPQVRRAIRALETRELVAVSREHLGWKTVTNPTPWKGRLLLIDPAEVDQTPGAWRFEHNGEERGAVLQMPVSGLVVWLPAARAGHLAAVLKQKMDETAERRMRTAPLAELAEFERLTGQAFLDVVFGDDEEPETTP
jgi:hypothetical protein